MTTERHTAAMFLSPLAPMLRRTGMDPAAVFARHGIALQDTMNPEAQVTVLGTAALLEECEALLGDPSLGINMARHAEYSTFGALGLALAAGLQDLGLLILGCGLVAVLCSGRRST